MGIWFEGDHSGIPHFQCQKFPWYKGLFPQAPAKKLAEYGDALQEELGSGTSALHHSTRSVVKGTLKNASRQYQRAARRFKMAMPPDLC